MTSSRMLILNTGHSPIISAHAAIGTKTLAPGWILRLMVDDNRMERGMPSGLRSDQDLDRKRFTRPAADQTAAHSAALERLRDNGDKAAFEELYVYFAPRLIVFFERRGLDRRRSQEIMQDVMTKIWEKAPLFDSSKASAPTWIFTLARNHLIDVVRKDKRSRIDLTDPALAPSVPVSPDQSLQEKDRSAALRRAILALPADQAAVLTGIYIDGLKQSDVAQRLGIPLNTVKSRLRLAISKIRTSLEASQ